MKYATIRIICGDDVDEIKIEETIFLKAEKYLAAQGLTLEDAILIFINYSVEHGIPFTAEEIQEYKDEQERIERLMLPTAENMKHISSEYLVTNFEEALELCEEQNAICIDEDGYPNMILMTIEAYEEWSGEKIELSAGGENV